MQQNIQFDIRVPVKQYIKCAYCKSYSIASFREGEKIPLICNECIISKDFEEWCLKGILVISLVRDALRMSERIIKENG